MKTESESKATSEEVENNETVNASDSNLVNFSKYGAVGDGKTDDTNALQAAFDSGDDLVGTPGATY